MSINLISSKDSDENRNMHKKIDNIEIMTGRETDDTIDELFKSILQKYQKGLEESMKGSEFIFDSQYLLYYNLQIKFWTERDHHIYIYILPNGWKIKKQQ